jgi:hypothetical protein
VTLCPLRALWFILCVSGFTALGLTSFHKIKHLYKFLADLMVREKIGEKL